MELPPLSVTVKKTDTERKSIFDYDLTSTDTVESILGSTTCLIEIYLSAFYYQGNTE